MRFTDTLRSRRKGFLPADEAIQASFARAAEFFGEKKFSVARIVRRDRELTVDYRSKRRQISIDQFRNKLSTFGVPAQ